MTVQIAPALSTCPKCGGRLAYDQVGHEIDVVCMTCGKRQVAVAEVPVRSSPVPVKYNLGICEHCEEEFTPYTEAQRFCTRQHQGAAATLRRSEATWAALAAEIRVCPWCEGEFTPERAHQRYCCKQCEKDMNYVRSLAAKKVKRNA